MAFIKKLGQLLILSGLLASCLYKDNGNAFPPGTYKGKLVLLAGLIDTAPTDVTLIFNGGRFLLQSDPSSCCNSGTYKFLPQAIEFTNECAINCFLRGEFQLETFNRRIKMTKASNGMTLIYDLTLQ